MEKTMWEQINNAPDTDILEQRLVDIGEILYDHAERLYQDNGFGEDFCIQTVGRCAVFGAVNRLYWHPLHGFYVHAHECTDNFVETMTAGTNTAIKVYK